MRKRILYARQRIPEYWIVDVDARVVERWRPDDEQPDVLSERLESHSRAERDPLTIVLFEYFARSPATCELRDALHFGRTVR